MQKSTGYLIANTEGVPIYDRNLNVFIKANTSVNTVIASSYNYLIDNGLYADCTVNATYIDGRNMIISLTHLKDPSDTNEFQLVYVNLTRLIPSSSSNSASTSLSGGEIAGAVIGAIFGFALLVGIIYFFYVKYARKMAYFNNTKKLDEHDRETYTETRNVLFSNNMHQTGQYDL